MAANHLQADEKAKSTLQTQKEKYQNEIEKLEKENNDLKVRFLILKFPYAHAIRSFQTKTRTMKQLQTRCTELENQVKSDEEIKRNLHTRLEEFQVILLVN